jgi:YegS/Rv2252/BmrU family lipid kinase
MKYLFILNPRAGRKKTSKEIIDSIDRSMVNSGTYYEFAFTTAEGDATRLARDAVDKQFDMVVAVGGDGTVNEVGTGLVNTDVALGIIPLGSGNGVARSLNIPIKLDEAIAVLLSAKISEIDVGVLNGKNFIGIAGTGYDALVGKKFQTFGTRGPLPYFLISLNEYLRYRYQEYELDLEDNSFKVKALLVTFANTREYGNGAVIAPQANPADGIINICIITPLTLWGAVRAAYMLFNNTINKHPGFIDKQCHSARVHSGGAKMYIHRDGEPGEVVDTIEVGVKPRALRICLPPDGIK